jgi:hypothetical protein
MEGMTGEKSKKQPTEYDFFEWYITHGIRRVNGVTFRPLRFGETNEQAVGEKINTFRGFAAQQALNDEKMLRQFDRQLSIESLFHDKGKESDLAFLLMHVTYLMGEDEREYEMMLGDIHNAGIKTTSTGQFLAWLANMTFDPAEKVPRYYVLQGPPGCGKSSFIKAVSEKLLHPAHVRIYTDVQRLVEMFNGHASENVLTGLEEVNMNDLNNTGLRQLQELVSTTERYERQLYKEGEMVADYRRFFVATNVLWPIPLPPGQRRCVLARFNHRIGILLEKDNFRDNYLSRLERILNSTDTMNQFAHFLLRQYHTPDRMATFKRAVHLTRMFNFETLETQLIHLKNDSNTSVLGWLYQHLVNLDDFFPEEMAYYYVRPEDSAQWVSGDPKRKRSEEGSSGDFMKWKNLLALTEKNEEGFIGAPNGFTGRWRDTVEDTDATYEERCEQRRARASGYWIRAFKTKFYESYKAVIPERSRLNLTDFTESVRHILGSNKNEFGSDGYLLETTVRDKNTSKEVWCFAPLGGLEEAFKNAVPNAQELKWDSYRLTREKNKQRMQL